MTAPVPMMIPSIVKNERILLAARLRKDILMLSNTFMLLLLP